MRIIFHFLALNSLIHLKKPNDKYNCYLYSTKDGIGTDKYSSDHTGDHCCAEFQHRYLDFKNSSEIFTALILEENVACENLLVRTKLIVLCWIWIPSKVEQWAVYCFRRRATFIFSFFYLFPPHFIIYTIRHS